MPARIPDAPPEYAAVASARTNWSTPPGLIPHWKLCHNMLEFAASQYEPAPAGKFRLVLFGDALIEGWRGTAMCRRRTRSEAVPEVLKSTLGAIYPWPMVLGIASDQTQHLLWRLEHGLLAKQMQLDRRLISLALIGASNIRKGFSSDETSEGVLAVVDLLVGRTVGPVVLHGLLPRADMEHGRATKHADLVSSSAEGKKIYSFMPAIERVNAAMRNATSLPKYAGRVHYVDCSDVFVKVTYKRSLLRPGQFGVTQARQVRTDVMPDGVHPNSFGYQQWASCLERALSGVAQQHQ
mmetsp:Transcript_21525/g.46313  ORF Transcript_21525/g.46313 Transcript_21525/m.46313 type:complete len:295 (-) Transcript_21525:383-1267(-)